MIIMILIIAEFGSILINRESQNKKPTVLMPVDLMRRVMADVRFWLILNTIWLVSNKLNT